MDNISLNKANECILSYKQQFPNEIQSYQFSLEAIAEILATPGTTGIRLYNGIYNDKVYPIIVATKTDSNGDEQDILSPNAHFPIPRPCPTMCGKDNQLNS